METRVVLPEPDGPSSSTISPASTEMSAPLTAATADSPDPNVLVRPLAVMTLTL